MNLPALWAYCAGITTGLMWPIAKARWAATGKGKPDTSTALVFGVMGLLVWPLFAIGLLCGWRAAQLEEKSE